MRMRRAVAAAGDGARGRSGTRPSYRHRAAVGAGTALALATISALAGCGAGPGTGGKTPAVLATATQSPLARCGTARTAGGVAVEIVIERGTTRCSTALAVEREYAHAIASGHVAGNGGGAPVRVHGWVCQGFNTPDVLATGNTSVCQHGSSEIMAVLPGSPSPTPSP